MEATPPTCLSNLDSITEPTAYLFGFAFKSNISAVARIVSNNSSIFWPVWAEILTNGYSPPHSSGVIFKAAISSITLFGLASGLSILLTATIIGTLAALAWSIASLVWGITPSSAATMIITISVTLVPRARIAVNAAWPGVSINVIGSPLWTIW